MSSIDILSSRPGSVLRFTGGDHVDFLQGQGTADLNGPSGLCRYNLWLNHKGLIQADGFVLRLNDLETLLVSYESPAETLIAKFEHHIIADDVNIEDLTSRWRLLSIPAEEADHLLAGRARHLEPERFFIEADGYVFAGKRFGTNSVDYLVPEQTSLPLDLNRLSIESAEALRIRAGFPSIPRDIAPDTFNPVEAGLLSAVSFTKGCYLGQEVVARVHRLQRVSKRLIRARWTTREPGSVVPPFELGQDKSVVGNLTSVAENPDKTIALGWLKSRLDDGAHRSGDLALEIESLPPQ